MFPSNAPNDYRCPVCLGIQRIENEHTLIAPTDIIQSDDTVSALISSFFVGNNRGHVLVVPTAHFENIYDLPAEVGHRIFDAAQAMAKLIKKTYRADGITIRQNNEPAADQHAFHYHLHVYPRYRGDGFNEVTPERRFLAARAERARYATRLRDALAGTADEG